MQRVCHTLNPQAGGGLPSQSGWAGNGALCSAEAPDLVTLSLTPILVGFLMGHVHRQPVSEALPTMPLPIAGLSSGCVRVSPTWWTKAAWPPACWN